MNEIERLLGSVKLGPELEFRYSLSDDSPIIAMNILRKVPDVTQDGHPEVNLDWDFVVTMEQICAAVDPAQMLRETIFHNATQFIVHELQEWFEFDGKRVDPHG